MPCRVYCANLSSVEGVRSVLLLIHQFDYRDWITTPATASDIELILLGQSILLVLLYTIHGHGYFAAFSHSIYSEGGLFSHDRPSPTIVTDFIGCCCLASSPEFMYIEHDLGGSGYCHTKAGIRSPPASQ